MACDSKTMLLMSCYADGETTPEESARAREHLEQCPRCRALVEDWEGQRRVFEWTYAVDVPEETQPDWRGEVAEDVKRIPAAWKIAGVWEWFKGRSKGFAWVGGLAVVVLVGLVIYNFAYLPPVIGTGEPMTAGTKVKHARMNWWVDLEIGPGSAVTRVDDRTVRLDKGWLSATVRNGSEIRVLTRRLEVVDRGTRFRVGTGSKMDYVVVQSGAVDVSTAKGRHSLTKDQVLMAYDNGESSVAALPEVEDEKAGEPLGHDEKDFVPGTAVELKWREERRELANRFPDVRTGELANGSTGCYEETGVEINLEYFNVTDLQSGLRERFREIAQFQAGERVDNGSWTIPVMVMQVEADTSSLGLTSDTYLVQLVPKDGRIVWRFSGSNGSDVDHPVVFKSKVNYGPGENDPVAFSPGKASGYEGRISFDETMQLAAWPGEFKPTLDLSFDSKQSHVSPSEQAIIMDGKRAVAGVEGVTLDRNPHVLYLDSDRRNRFLVVWNTEAGKQLCHLSDRVEQGHGGSVVIGVIATDMPLVEPKAGPGVYLVQFVVSDPNKAPYIALTTPDMKGLAGWGDASYRLPVMKIEEHSGGGGSMLNALPGYYGVSTGCALGAVDHGAFPIGFGMDGRPDGRSVNRFDIRSKKSDSSTQYYTAGWAEGWIRVSKP